METEIIPMPHASESKTHFVRDKLKFKNLAELDLFNWYDKIETRGGPRIPWQSNQSTPPSGRRRVSPSSPQMAAPWAD